MVGGRGRRAGDGAPARTATMWRPPAWRCRRRRGVVSPPARCRRRLVSPWRESSAPAVVVAVRSCVGRLTRRADGGLGWPVAPSDWPASVGASIAGGAATATGTAEGSVVAATKRLVAAVSGATGPSSRVARRARSPRPTIWLRPIVPRMAGGGSVRSRWLTRRSWSRAWAHSSHAARWAETRRSWRRLAVRRTIWASAWRASRHSRGIGPRPAGLAEVGLQVVLGERTARPHGQRSDRLRRRPRALRHVGVAEALHLGQPEHRPHVRRQLVEGLAEHRPLGGIAELVASPRLARRRGLGRRLTAPAATARARGSTHDARR